MHEILRFCAIKTGRPPAELDWEEPMRVADAARKMALKHVVLTSINRDDRKDGGALFLPLPIPNYGA